MANELKHGSVGTELTQAEWEGVGAHVFNSQATGDIVYASSSSQLSRLAKGTDTHVLILSSGIPAWSTSTGITAVGTIATGTWQGTDVGVAYGGTGVSTLASNSVLTGNGSSAITAEANLTFDGSTLTLDGDLTFTGAQTIAASAGNLSINAYAGSAIRLNDAQANVDVVIESDTADNLFYADAGTNTIGIGTTASDRYAVTVGTTITGSTGNSGLLRTTGTVNAVAGQYAFGIRAGGTFVEAGSGTHPMLASLYVQAPTVTNGSGTTTAAASLYIAAAPSSVATTDYALFVDAGNSRFDGDIILDGDLDFTGPQTISTSSGNLTIGAATGADVLICDNATILYVDGGTGGIGVGGAPSTLFHVTGTFTATVSKPNAFRLGPTLTTTAGTADQTPSLARLDGSIVTAAEGSGTEYDLISTLSLKEPGITLGSNTTTALAATLYIEDAPSEGVLDYALLVASGASRFDGAVEFGQDGTNHDVTFYGDTSGRNMVWDAGQNALKLKDNTTLYFGTGDDAYFYYNGTNLIVKPNEVGSGTFQIATGSIDLNNQGSILNVGASGSDWDSTSLRNAGDYFGINGKGMVIGHTAFVTLAGGETPELQVLGTGGPDSTFGIGRWSDDAYGPALTFNKSRDPAIADGSFAIVEDDDILGMIRWGVDDGTDFNSVSADVRVEVDDGSPAANDVGAAIIWRQMAGGGGALLETMRMTPAGNMGIGTAVPGSYHASADNLVIYGSGDSGITIASGTSSNSAIYFADGTSGNAAYRGYIDYDHNSDYGFRIGTSGTGSLVLSGGATPTMEFAGASTISTASSDLTIGVATGADVLIGDNDTILAVDGGVGRGRVTIGAYGDEQAAEGLLYLNPNTVTVGANRTYSYLYMSNNNVITIPSGTSGLVTAMNIEIPNITATGTVTKTATVRIAGAMTEGTTNYALLVDAGVSRFDGNVDLNSTGTLLNVGASGHDWNATHLIHETDNEGGYSVINNKNSAAEVAASFAVTTTEVHANSTGDAYFSAGVSGVLGWNFGVDLSQSSRLAIGNATLGNNDALRATNATPPVVTYNTSHPTGTFDYVCESCGTHQAELFNCCGVVEWHDDVMDFRAMALQDESAIDYMERVGVVERTTTNDGKPELFTKLGADFHFAMSAAYQNRQRMDAQNEAMDARLKRIEQALGV